jgi:anti-sigma regulatory factor (Ser/Thr protein kinase)
MVMKSCTIGNIAAEINKTLRRFLPDHMLFAATLIEFNAAAETATIWCGGMPQALIAREGRIVDVIDSDHMPLAALEQHEFSQDVKIIKLNEGDKIYIFTDGVEESRNERDEMFGETRLYDLFDGKSKDIFSRIIDELMIFTLSTEQEDDITLVEYTVDKNAFFSAPEHPQENEERLRAIPWTLELRLSPEEMRKSDPVVQIITLLKNAIGLNVHQDFISTILSELYSNALEHGLLGLASELKHTENGFSEYYLQRRDRLDALTEGTITINLDFRPNDDEGYVLISITDSGIGFDVEAVKARKALNTQQINDEDSFGRGINILDELCTDLDYSNGGRTVTAKYPLKNAFTSPPVFSDSLEPV